MKKALLFLLAIQFAHADDQQKVLAGYDPKVDIIADNYEAGPHLIYDCEEGHWTCVLESYYKECEEKRREDKELKKVKSRCAPLESLPTKKSCFQRQLFMVSNNFGTRFCILPGWKEKEIITTSSQVPQSPRD